MAHRIATRHDVNGPNELDPSVLSCITHLVGNRPMRRLDEHRTKADRERELIVIHRDIAERKREVVTHVNHQLLMQIKVLREAHQRVIEMGTWEIQMDSSPEVNQHPATPTDLRFKLNEMRSKVTILYENPENL